MDKIRSEIDILDAQIMSLLNRRFALTSEIGRYKNEKNLPILNYNREKEILNKANCFPHYFAIKNVYQEILKNSRLLQVQYGLIGKSLPYSLSPLIYQELGMNNYQIIETNDFENTLNNLSFRGINVTIPYKSRAYLFCKKLDESAIKTKTVNTIICNTGYNTDYLAFKQILKKYNLDLTNKKVVIIGNGATSRTIAATINARIYFLVRHVRSDRDYLLANYEKFIDCDYLINTTPYGTFPNIENKPLFPLAKFKKLLAVIDVIYNPLNSPLILEAKRNNIKTMNGLELLVTQANLSYNLFKGTNINKVENILNKLQRKLYNIVLIGMPFSGKTYVGKKLSMILNKKLIDIDERLKKVGHDLNTLIKAKPISVFRKFEEEEVLKYCSSFNQVISTGGGVVLSSKAMQALKRNGIVIFLNPSFETLIKRFNNTRPLVKTINDLSIIYKERLPLYRKYKDIEIENDDVDKIVEKIYEYFNNQWS